MTSSQPILTFPDQLDRVRDVMRGQAGTLQAVAQCFADALAAGNVVHVYANGHSRVAVEELCVRMGALTGFHPILQGGITTFTDVIGANGLRLCQTLEKVEGLGEKLLDEYEIAPGEPLLVVSATGQTQAAVDIALAWRRRFPENPLVALCSREQAQRGLPKHSSGQTLWHAVQAARRGFLLDNAMPHGDTSVRVDGLESYAICPLSSVGAVSVIQCLNELTLRELDRRGVRHHVLRNMHLNDTRDSYNEWLVDQRRRYARTLSRNSSPAHA